MTKYQVRLTALEQAIRIIEVNSYRQPSNVLENILLDAEQIETWLKKAK